MSRSSVRVRPTAHPKGPLPLRKWAFFVGVIMSSQEVGEKWLLAGFDMCCPSGIDTRALQAEFVSLGGVPVAADLLEGVDRKSVV